MAGFFERHGNVYMYIPNLIGYARIAAVLFAFAVANYHPYVTVISYFLSFVCDELDGRFARKFNQSSTFGAVLDMVTDRLATMGLLMLLAVMFPNLLIVNMCLIFLDIFSHWFQMYATLAMGATTHKDVKSRSWMVRTYYSNRVFMGYCCICCEVLYLVIYAAKWPQLMWLQIPGIPLQLPAQVTAIAPVLKAYESTWGIPCMAILGVAAIPGFVTKQVCNWIQLRSAADLLIQYDAQKKK